MAKRAMRSTKASKAKKSPSRVAEDAMPGWEAVGVTPAQDAIQDRTKPRFAGRSLAYIRQKLADRGSPAAKKHSFAGSQDMVVGLSAATQDTHLVRMRNKQAKGSDATLGEKVAVVSGGKVIGVQG